MRSRVKTNGKWEYIDHKPKTSTGRTLTDKEKAAKAKAKADKKAAEEAKTEKLNEQEKVEQK